MKRALRGGEVSPSPTLAGMKGRSNLPFLFSVCNARIKVADVHRVFSEILDTHCLGKQYVVRDAKVDGSLGPAIGVQKASVVLISAGDKPIDPRDDRSGIRRH